MSGLPKGWTDASLAEAGNWCSGGTPSRRRSDFFGNGIPWVKSGDLPDGPINETEEEITEIGLYNSSAKLLPAGTISMALYGATIGKLGTMAFPAATNQACANVVPNKQLVETKYLFFYLLSQRQSFIDLGQGGAQPNISQEIVRKHPLPLPPLNEQRRIVAKLDSLLGKVEVCQQRLAKIPGILKRFRQAVFAAACSGRLTADWREDNEDLEDAVTLLSTVKKQRKARYQAECFEAKMRGQQTPKFEWSDLNPDFSVYDLPDLPEKWAWSHVSKFGFVKGGKRIPKGETLVKENTGHPYLRIRDLRDGSVDRSQILYVPKHVFPSIQNYIIRSGDVYLTIVGTIGDAGTIPTDFDEANLTENAAKVVQPVGLSPEYLASWFRSPYCQRFIQQNIYSGGQGKLALFRIEQLPVPLAPLSEQHEIVRRVEALFTLADQLEVRYSKAKAHVDRLTQSILAKAFRGELVPQDENDEPASVLLERIRAQRTQAAPVKRQVASRREKAPSPQPLSPMARGKKKTPPRGEAPLPLVAEAPAAYTGNIPRIILAHMQPGVEYTRAEIISATGITAADWTWAIRQLREEGKVVQTGERRGARYRKQS